MKLGDLPFLLIRFDHAVLTRVAQPAIDFCSRKFGWHFITIGQTITAIALAAWFIWGLWLGHRLIFVADNAAIGYSVLVASVFCTIFNGAQISHAIKTAQANPQLNANVYTMFGARLGNWMGGVMFAPLVLVPPYALENNFFVLYLATLNSGIYVLSCQQGTPKEQRTKAPIAAAIPEAV